MCVMCQMENNYLSSSLKSVSFNLNDSWAAKTWDSAYSLQYERARFQQKQLQEKEEKLLKLYEEQQERALKSVGSHCQSGGSSSSSVGVGKVRHLFQSRRGNSESRVGAPIIGRDKSYPLEPLSKENTANRRFTHAPTSARWGSTSHQRSVSLDRNHNEVSRKKNENYFDLDEDENYNYTRGDTTKKVGVRRTQSQVRSQKPRTNAASNYSGSHADFEESPDYSFQLVDDCSGARESRYSKFAPDDSDDYFVANFNTKRQFYENRLKSELNNNKSFSKYSSGDLAEDKMESRYKSYVSQSTFGKKPHLGNGSLTGRTGVTTTRVTEVKETSSGYLNGTSSPVRKIRKPTPVPLSVTPSQHLLQKEVRKTTRTETIKEIPSSVSSTRTPSTRTPTSLPKPPTSGRSLTSTRTSTTKSTSSGAPATRSPPQGDLVNCRICGRHFAADRVSKHEEVCQKSSRKQRKPFDALKQRVKGTEVERYIKKSAKGMRPQDDKDVKPTTNWRKKHEELINNIRAAKEVSAHLKKGGKASDLPPPPPSDYSDYIQCPHCNRKFNEAAAERHIPKCANMIHNKPKPNMQKNTGLKSGSKILQTASPAVRGRK